MKKVLSVFLAISLALSVFLVMPVSAEYHTFKQFSLDSSNEVITYEDSFWDNFGENLIKDPTIAAENFDSDGNYMRYAKITADYQPVEINENHWWDKYVTLDDGFVHYYECMQKDKGVVFAGPDENGYYTIPTGNLGVSDTSCHGYTFTDRMARSLANRTDVLLRDGTEIGGVTFNSLTDDGSGVIRIPGVSNGASRRMPLPAMEENSYYVVKFKMLKNQDIQDTCILLELEVHDGYYHGGIEPGKGTHDYTGNLGNGQADTVVFLVYTGDKSFSDPCIDIKNTAGTSTYISFDDFGMYKVSEEYAAAQVDGVKLTDYEDGTETVSDPSGIQVCVDSEGNLISYSDSFWNSLGENLIPDPTVANFVDDGSGNMVYGRYSKITADYKPADVDARYWWDKYIDEEQGFTYYYKNKVRDEGAVTLSGPDENGNYTIPAGSLGNVAKQGGQYKCDGVVYNPMLRSPANRVIYTEGSLTSDGSGVIYTKTGGGWRALPLPAMEANSYYVVKYKMRINELFIDPDLTIINLGLRLTPPSESTPAENDISNPFIVSDFYEGIDKHTIPTFNGCFNTTDTFTVAFMVYTGSNSYTDPCIDIYLNTDIFLDDFGMYKVSEEYAAEQREGVKLTSAAAPAHDHTGGTATCHSKAVCTVCGEEYGEFDANNHDGGTEVRDAVEANCTEAGYTGDTYCLGCGEKIADGEAIEAGHTADHWKCGKIATTEEDGLRYKICDVCGARFGDEVVPKIVMPVIEPGENVPEIVVESKTAPAGSTVDVKISLKNNPGIASMKLTVEYDEGLTLKAPVAYDIYPEEADPEMPQVIQPADAGGASPVVLNWISPLADVNGDLVYATLTFEVAAEAEGEQNITVTYNPNDIYNLAEENIGFAVTNGKITVGELSHIRGDINGDGEVDNKDLTRLFQYLSNWDVEVNKPALDVNGDSSVDNKDLTRLFQYLSNWDVVIY